MQLPIPLSDHTPALHFCHARDPAGLVVDFEEVEISFTSESGDVIDLNYVGERIRMRQR